jgi:predicted ATPase/DNA-binding SARP family transcriptional activator
MSGSKPPGTLRLLLLGTPQIERDGALVDVDTRKAIALVAYLAVTEQAHSREALAGLLWPEYEPERAYANLRRTLWSLNKAVGHAWLDADQETVTLQRGQGFWLDVEAFQGHLETCQAHGHDTSEACPACFTPLTEAVSLYRGDFMAGFTLRDSPGFDEWQFFQAEGLRRDLASALERLVRCHIQQGEFEPAIAHARRWLALDPLHEAAHRALMTLYAWAGQQAAALRQYGECVRVLEEELGVPPEGETSELYEAIRRRELPPPPVAGAPGAAVSAGERLTPQPQHNLPHQPTSFVGRISELNELGRLLRDPACRLLALVGSGGIGKTRLAIQAALQAAGEPKHAYRDGIRFVPLAALDSPRYIVPTVAEALAFSFNQREGADPKQQLLDYLCEKQMLLVLDNFEHLLEGAGLIGEILSIAPRVKALVTSRERLNLRGEWVLEVQGMRFPEDLPVASLEEYSAVQLVRQRASQVDVGFTPAQADVPHLIRICRLLEGMPLGIELAAAWARTLSCQEIAQEIEKSLDFLDTAMRDLPERHRSLRAVFDQSWQLLADVERDAFRRLSVFRGGFDRDAAEQVAGARLPLLSALVEKSLLRRDPSGRYTIHETLRQYAAHKLDEAPQEKEVTQDGHCRYFAAFLQHRVEDLKGARQREALDEIAAELENVRVAWRWAIAQARLPQIRQAAEALFLFYEGRSLFQEGEEAFGQTVAALKPEASPPAAWGVERDVALGMALAFQGYLGYFFQTREQAMALVRGGLEILRPLGVGKELALASTLAIHSGALEDAAEAERMLQESLAVFEAIGDRWGIARCLLWSGLAVFAQHGEAKRRLQKSLALCREIGDRRGEGFAIFALGELTHVSAAYEEARQYFHESLTIARQVGNRWGVEIGLDYLGYVIRELGDYAEARRLHLESLAVARQTGDRLGVAGSWDNLGLVARDEGDYEQARRQLEKGLAIRAGLGAQWEVGMSMLNLGSVALAIGDHEAAAQQYEDSLSIFQGLAWASGLAMAHHGVGEVATAAGDVEQAWQHLRTALEVANQDRFVRVLPDILVGVARLRVRVGGYAQAAELLALVQHHPASTQYARAQASHLLAELAQHLAPESIRVAQERGAAAELEEVVAAVLDNDWDG